MVKRIIVFFLIMVLVISPVSVYASSAGSVVVSGGSIATGGLSSGYSDKTEKTAITLSMALLYSLGVTVKLTQEAITAGKTAYDFLRDKFAQWVGGTSAEELTESERDELKKRFQVINGGGGSSEDPDQQPDNGFNVGPDGKIYCSPGTITMLKKFIDWLESTGQINNVPASNGLYNTFYGHTLYYRVNQPDRYISTYTDNTKSTYKDCYYGQYRQSADSTNYNFFVFNTEDFFCEATHDGSGSYGWRHVGAFKYTYSFNDYVIYNNAPVDGLVDISQYGYYGGDGIKAYLKNLVPGEQPETSDGLYKDENYDPDALNNPDNNQTIIDPGLIPTIADDNPGKDYQVSVDDYIEAIRQVLNEKTNPADVPEQLPVTDVPTGVTVPVNIPADQPVEWPITTPSSPTATPDVPTCSTPVVDPATPADPETAMPKLTFPLDKYFPFCIPFDVYALLSKFSAEPVTPVFDVGFTEPFTNSEVNLHIDLSPWNGVATAIRTAELGAFIVGLALLSKQIFTRG